MQILVTGHKGFIGGHLTKKLDSIGVKWVGYDLKDGNDIRDKLNLERFFDSYPIDAVIHLAALTGARRGETYPQEYFDTNVIGTENVARACEKYEVSLMAFSSASAKTRQNTYGITKHAMELMLEKINLKSLHVIRPFNVYGEEGRPDQVVWKWKERAESGLPIEYHGNLLRNYTYVGELVDYVCSTLNKMPTGFSVVDAGNPNQVGLGELLEVFREKYPNLSVVEKKTQDVPTHPENSVVAGEVDFISKVKELIA